MSPLARIFGILFAIFVVVWAVMYAVIIYQPQNVVGLSIPMMLAGWGTGIFFILFLVMFILKR